VNTIFRFFPLSQQSLNNQTFTAWTYRLNGNNSTYPFLVQIGVGQPFAVHLEDPNDDSLYVHPNDLRNALYSPLLKGFNHARPFQYRVTLPPVVRDRVHDCAGIDSFYRIPFIGPLLNLKGPWSVSQGNNGTFTHMGWQKYAFDFPAAANTPVLAARGGIVDDIRETGCFSCWNPNWDNGDGTMGACVTGSCMGDFAANFVRIRHQDGTYAEYFHFKKGGVQVSEGQRVYRGDFIGSVGTTGCSTGNHLHLHVLNKERTETIPIRFEAFDSNMTFRECYLPPSSSSGFSSNEPWNWPF
jgi:murein DD-endopeptidase MepM/ murein hydrolase activator NlpD